MSKPRDSSAAPAAAANTSLRLYDNRDVRRDVEGIKIKVIIINLNWALFMLTQKIKGQQTCPGLKYYTVLAK